MKDIKERSTSGNHQTNGKIYKTWENIENQLGKTVKKRLYIDGKTFFERKVKKISRTGGKKSSSKLKKISSLNTKTFFEK